MMWWLAHAECDVPPTDDWLSAHERAHVASIRFTKRRNEYLTRRWTSKRAIAAVLDLDHTPTDLARIEIRHHPSGAPYVHLDGSIADVDVSMSDRSGWAVCLVRPSGPMSSGAVGIDLEVVESRSERFVADYFTVAEQRHVAALSPAHRDAAANLIWSAKEAALKVQQVGLRADTRTVEVDLHGAPHVDGWAAMTIHGRDGSMPGWWRRFGVFLLTIAFAQPYEPPRVLASTSQLDHAEPHHSWVDSPIC